MPTDPGPRLRGYLAPPLADSSAWSALLDAPLASLACDDHGQLLFLNQAMLTLLEQPLERLLGTGWVACVCGPSPAALEAAQADLREVLASRGTIRHRRHVGERAVEMTCAAIRLPDGAQGMMMIAGSSPAIERMSAHPAAGRSYCDLVEDAADLMARFEPGTGRVLFVNRAVERFTGHPPAAFLADPALFETIVHPEYRGTWQQSITQLGRVDTRAFDLGLQHTDGRQTMVQMVLYPIRDAKGTVTAIEGTARDVTAVRQLEQLRARNEERASLDRLKSQLLANVSHELRTPLVSIKGYNELLLRGALGPLTPRQRRGLEIAGANTERLIELIESLLDFARREEERLELQIQRFDVRAAVEDAIRALQDRIASRNLKLRVELGTQALLVAGDHARLAQVFRALIGNAEKFTETREGEPNEILITALRDEHHVEIAVTDRGIGIPKEAQTKIFDRFYQVDASSTRRYGGAGLGLALAKELVTLHGGEIRVESQEKRGSTFTVRLPLAQGEAAHEGLPPRPVVLVGAAEATFVDVRRLLEGGDLGPLDIFPAYGEGDVLRRARRHRPDLVLIAFQKPDRVVAQLKRETETSNLPVVVISSDGRRPIGRADLVTEVGDQARLVQGLQRLLSPAPPAERRAQIVIVEDELEILDFTRFVLEREGYDVVCLTRGEEALRTVNAETGLVILDIALEGADGIDIARSLKSNHATREVPILIMTAMSGDEVRQVSLEAGAEGYLMKPFGVDEFLRQVKLHSRLTGSPNGHRKLGLFGNEGT